MLHQVAVRSHHVKKLLTVAKKRKKRADILQAER